jgi:hypothetical protein
MGDWRDPRQDAWDAGQREYNAEVAKASAAEPDKEWIVALNGVRGWVRRQDA